MRVLCLFFFTDFANKSILIVVFWYYFKILWMYKVTTPMYDIHILGYVWCIGYFIKWKLPCCVGLLQPHSLKHIFCWTESVATYHISDWLWHTHDLHTHTISSEYNQFTLSSTSEICENNLVIWQHCPIITCLIIFIPCYYMQR